MTFQLAGQGAEIYEDVMVPLWFGRWADAMLETVAPQPGDRLLDVACGTGVTTRLAQDKVGHSGHVVGLDINAPMLAKARELAGARDITWIESDVTDSGLPDGSFDLIISQHGYHYFPDKPAALAEFRRLLAPGGRLFYSIWDGHSPYTQALCTAVAAHISPEIAAKQRAQRETQTAAELTTQAVAAGFAQVAVHRQELQIDVPMAEEFVPLHLGSMPIADAFLALDTDQQQALARQVQTALAGYVTQGRMCYPDAVHLVSAQL
tara:strand:+ start:51 stop:842 length:792 start_codon:yes stop_codon:yes gene_type:complete